MNLAREWWASAEHAMNYDLLVIGQTHITPWTLLSIAIVGVLTVVASRVAQRAIHRTATARGLRDSDGSVSVVQRIVHYSVLVAGVFVALHAMGLDLGTLAAAGAVFAVAVGLSMQSLTQNLVSGLVLLFERSVDPGDVLVVDGVTVLVHEIGLRSTICRSRDGDELIVPNSVLVQTIVRNHTLSDPAMRVRLELGLRHGTDLRRAREVLLAAADGVAWRVAAKPPILLVLAFGRSSIDVELSVWTDDPWTLPQRKTELALAAWDALQAAGLSIAPHRLDVHATIDGPAGGVG